MIDFKNPEFIKLRPVSNEHFQKLLSKIMIEGEAIIASFQSVRDGIVFTDKRIISVNVQGVTGKKKDITSLPYKKIQVFSVESSGVFDLDCELVMYFSGLGHVRFEITGGYDVTQICKLISDSVL